MKIQNGEMKYFKKKMKKNRWKSDKENENDEKHEKRHFHSVKKEDRKENWIIKSEKENQNDEKQNGKHHSHSASHSVLYPGRESNPHSRGTGFWIQRVYQFRHLGLFYNLTWLDKRVQS